MHRIGVEERRARLAVRHRLAPAERADTVGEAARSVVCLHASDAASVYLSPWARMHAPTIEAVDRALYEDRELIRMLAMRRTMFVVPTEDAPILHAAASLGVARVERKRNRDLVAQLGLADVDGWLKTAEADTLVALDRRGEATAQELARDVAALGQKVRLNVGKSYESRVSVSSRVLLLLAADGRVVRSRPRGTWVSNQYRWVLMERWLGHPLPELSRSEAQAELVRRWLARFGPGSEADIRWWAGLPARDIRAALAAIGAIEVDIDGVTGYVLADDLEPTPAPGPWIALLPGLDPTTMGWHARDWYLGEYRSTLFDTSGNAGPTIWVDGRIVGGWAVRATGEVVTRLLEDVGRAAATAIAAEAARLTVWLQRTNAVPQYPTPLQKELVG